MTGSVIGSKQKLVVEGRSMLRPYHIILDPVSQGGVDDFGLPPGVRDEYLQGARDQLGTIAELAERLIASGDDTAAIEALRRDAHRLRGSAGSFGFHQASVVAAELEEAAKHWLDHPGNGVADRGQAARGYVRRLAAALFTKQSVAAPLAAPSPPIDVTAPSPPPSGDVPEVIVVEDDDTLAELLTFGLEARGYRYVLFRNGREALDQLEAGAMDYMVKPMSLRVALEKIRRWVGR